MLDTIRDISNDEKINLNYSAISTIVTLAQDVIKKVTQDKKDILYAVTEDKIETVNYVIVNKLKDKLI